MKTYRYILPFIFGLVITDLSAQDMSNVPDSIFFEYAKSLKNRGNDYYMLSNRTGIKQVIDEYRPALDKRKSAGNLSMEMESYFTQDITKLSGDYHYLNSDYDSKSYTEAERYFLQYRDYYLSHSGTYVAGQGVYVAHQELAQLYYKQGLYEEACDEMKAVMAVASTYMRDEDEQFDKLSQYAICQARVNQFDEAISNINEVLDNYENIDTERYGEALRKKAKILMLREEHGGETGKSEALDYYKQYFGLKKKDALAHFMGMSSEEREMCWMRIRPFVTDCYRLEDADAGFLYDVTLFAKGLLLQLDSAGCGRQSIHATWQMVQEKLKPTSCAIEFIQYEKYGQQQMGALVLKKEGKPLFVRMVSPDSVWNYKLGDYTIKERLERTDLRNFNAIDRVYNDSTGIFKLIWNQELLESIGDVKELYFAPDGYMHRIAIEYMIPEEVPSMSFFRLSSTRRLLEKATTISSSKALIVGGVDFNNRKTPMNGRNDALAYHNLRGLYFSVIENSKAEVDSILSCRDNQSDSLLSGVAADEHSFIELIGEYPIVHISTHGKFNAKGIPFGTDIKPCLTDETLSENMIALAGINAALTDKNFKPESQKDGILSAKEMSSLNMKNVQLAILACCESGLGHITSDGVYGIQRGLKNAGVGAIVMSLWEAESNFTGEFMVKFHKRLCEGYTIAEAFWHTRKEFLKTDDNMPSSRNVFILIDAIE